VSYFLLQGDFQLYAQQDSWYPARDPIAKAAIGTPTKTTIVTSDIAGLIAFQQSERRAGSSSGRSTSADPRHGEQQTTARRIPNLPQPAHHTWPLLTAKLGRLSGPALRSTIGTSSAGSGKLEWMPIRSTKEVTTTSTAPSALGGTRKRTLGGRGWG